MEYFLKFNSLPGCTSWVGEKANITQVMVNISGKTMEIS